MFHKNYPTAGKFTILKMFISLFRTNIHTTNLKYYQLSYYKVSKNSGPDSKDSFLLWQIASTIIAKKLKDSYVL